MKVSSDGSFNKIHIFHPLLLFTPNWLHWTLQLNDYENQYHRAGYGMMMKVILFSLIRQVN